MDVEFLLYDSLEVRTLSRQAATPAYNQFPGGTA